MHLEIPVKEHLKLNTKWLIKAPWYYKDSMDVRTAEERAMTFAVRRNNLEIWNEKGELYVGWFMAETLHSLRECRYTPFHYSDESVAEKHFVINHMEIAIRPPWMRRVQRPEPWDLVWEGFRSEFIKRSGVSDHNDLFSEIFPNWLLYELAADRAS